MGKPQVTVFTRTYPAKERSAPVEVFVTSKPSKPYEEIAQIKVNGLNDNRNLEDLRRTAREIGADGLILLPREKAYTLENATVSESVQYGYTAIAIRYK